VTAQTFAARSCAAVWATSARRWRGRRQPLARGSHPPGACESRAKHWSSTGIGRAQLGGRGWPLPWAVLLHLSAQRRAAREVHDPGQQRPGGAGEVLHPGAARRREHLDAECIERAAGRSGPRRDKGLTGRPTSDGSLGRVCIRFHSDALRFRGGRPLSAWPADPPMSRPCEPQSCGNSRATRSR
jgi:hypothetical protein